ncbi:HD domain-containing protein [Halomarina litorea]|uniref:HD domain-containing protein n=1 Tax=Halomarina litorea TaxID=2961595 RepID=UPI0020C25D46|nr:HD domain-containing protein [Halomarina sp. BCD28]
MDSDDDRERAVEAAFPELAAIEDDALRAGVRRAWTTAMADTGCSDLTSVPWFPPAQRRLGIDDEFLVDHVRDVTRLAVAMAETLHDCRTVDCDLDTVLVGALVHDVSKLYEFDGMDETPVGDLLGHPHYGVHVVSRAGLPVEYAHVVLSHTGRTTVDPATLEAEIIKRADEVAASAIRLRALDDLRDA